MSTTRLLAGDVSRRASDLIRAAEEIWLVDPHLNGSGRSEGKEWMELLIQEPPPVPDAAEAPSPACEPVIVEVGVDSTDVVALERTRLLIAELRKLPQKG